MKRCNSASPTPCRIASVLLGVGFGLCLACSPDRAEQAGVQDPTALAEPAAAEPGATWMEPESDAKTALRVVVKDGKLSVAIHNAMRRDVMKQISQQSGIEIIFLGKGEDVSLTEEFDGLPLEAGIRRLLKGVNTAFIAEGEGPDRRLKTVFVVIQPPGQPGEGPDQVLSREDVHVKLEEALARFKEMTGDEVPPELPEGLEDAIAELIRIQLLSGLPADQMPGLTEQREAIGEIDEDMQQRMIESLREQLEERLSEQTPRDAEPPIDDEG